MSLIRLLVRFHALERYRMHHPTATDDDVREAIARGTAENAEMVHIVTGRNGRGRLDKSSRYVVAEDQWGIFVIVDHCVVTYLRLEPPQRQALRGEKSAFFSEAPPVKRDYDGWTAVPLLETIVKRVDLTPDALEALSTDGTSAMSALIKLPMDTVSLRTGWEVRFHIGGIPLVARRSAKDHWVVRTPAAWEAKDALDAKKHGPARYSADYLEELERRYRPS